MTDIEEKKEAIETLKDMIEYQWGISDNEKSKGINALKVAINSLEKEVAVLEQKEKSH